MTQYAQSALQAMTINSFFSLQMQRVPGDCCEGHQKVLELDHYLDPLLKKPGVLPGSTALEQCRAQGRWPACNDRFWRGPRSTLVSANCSSGKGNPWRRDEAAEREGAVSRSPFIISICLRPLWGVVRSEEHRRDVHRGVVCASFARFRLKHRFYLALWNA